MGSIESCCLLLFVSDRESWDDFIAGQQKNHIPSITEIDVSFEYVLFSAGSSDSR